MKTETETLRRIYGRMCQHVALSAVFAGMLFGGAGLAYLVLSVLFFSIPVFFLFFGSAVGLGAWFTYQVEKLDDLRSKDPRITIKLDMEGYDDE